MLFTSESVTCGHPDKICDQISDAILDAVLAQDPFSKVAVDTWVKDNMVGIIGELTTSAKINFEEIVRSTVAQIGYNSDDLGFNASSLKFLNLLGQQSPEINQAVLNIDNFGAGDQGMMFGFANSDTPDLMPLPIWLAHRFAEKLESVRRQNILDQGHSVLRPDGKTQVTIEYDDQQKPKRIHTIVISTQHIPQVSQAELSDFIHKNIITETLEQTNLSHLLDENTIFHINPSGSFAIGGPVADSGLTGRKIVVDSYGGFGRVGGGAFSGKDFTKVDRSGAYMARYLAKWVVAQKWADTVEIQLSYAIGKAEPVSVEVYGNTFKSTQEISQEIQTKFDLTPKGIVNFLHLDKPIFQKTATYGHFGRSSENGFFTWENV